MKLALGALALIALALPASAQRQKDLCIEDVSAKLSPARVAPGGKSLLTITITMKGEYHIYDPKPGDAIAIPTKFMPLAAPGIKYGTPVFPKPTLFHGKTRIHEGVIVIKIPVLTSKTAKGMINVGGDLKVQACNETGCLPPFALKLVAPLILGAK